MESVSVAIPYLIAATLFAQPYDFTPHYTADEAFEAAYRAYKRGKWRVCEQKLRGFLETTTDAEMTQRGQYMLAKVLGKRARRVSKRVARDELRQERIALLNELVDYAPLAGSVHFALGRHYEGAGDPVSAQKHYGQVPKGGVSYLDARMAAAALAADRGRFDSALALIDESLEAGPGKSDRVRLRLMKGRVLAGLGKKDAAFTLLRQLWIDGYDKSQGRSAARALSKMKRSPKSAERVVLEFAGVRSGKRSTLLKRHRSLRREFRRAGTAAFDFARGVIESVNKKTRQRALRWFKKAAATRSGFVKGYALYRWARLLRKLGERDTAISKYRQLQKTLPKHPLAPDALVQAARLARKAGKDKLARRLLERLITKYPKHPKRVDYFWQLGWEAYKAGNYESAAGFFDRLGREEGTRKHLGQARWEERAFYWRGRCELELGQKRRAAATWAYLVTRYPLTYYSHQSFNRLLAIDPQRARSLRPHRPLGPYDIEALTNLDNLLIQRSPELEAAVELTRLGLFTQAREDLATRARSAALGPDGLTLLASLAIRQKRYYQSHALVRWRGTLPRYPDEAYDRLWKLAYPLPFWKTVQRNAKRRGLDPYLLIALIRHESGYNPRVVSRSGAVGLTQLLVVTARSVARKLLKTRQPNAKTLKKPEVNVRIGARFLEELLDHFKENEALALAGYNAGAARARGWYRKHTRAKRLYTDEFIEEIPYRETHSYVKSILATFGAYRYLYGSREDDKNRTIPLEVELPKRLGPYFSKRI